MTREGSMKPGDYQEMNDKRTRVFLKGLTPGQRVKFYEGL